MKRWPALPKRVEGMAGPIKVVSRRVESFRSDAGAPCWGLFRPALRQIDIAWKVPPMLRWHSLAHEWTHAWLIDAGIVNIIHGASEEERNRNAEIICDTLATAFVRSLATHLGIDPYAK